MNINNYNFIGANSIIIKEVTFGEKSFTGAGSAVTKSKPENEVWACNPANFIKLLNYLHL